MCDFGHTALSDYTYLLRSSCFSYKQRKFNLFREESEGYAKLLVELNQQQTGSSPEHMLETIKAIIGTANFLSCYGVSRIALATESSPEWC